MYLYMVLILINSNSPVFVIFFFFGTVIPTFSFRVTIIFCIITLGPTFSLLFGLSKPLNFFVLSKTISVSCSWTESELSSVTSSSETWTSCWCKRTSINIIVYLQKEYLQRKVNVEIGQVTNSFGYQWDIPTILGGGATLGCFAGDCFCLLCLAGKDK